MAKELFNFTKILEEHPILDLFYKSFLAIFLPMLFFYLASIGNENGGAYIKEAIESGRKGMYWNVIGSFAILFFLGGMWFKNIDLKIPHGRIKRYWSYPSTIIQKIARDILLSDYHFC